MAGLGLTNAVLAYQQGTQWRQDQEERALQKQRRDNLMQANQAGAEVISQAQKQHEADQAAALESWTKDKGTKEGFQAKPFRPDDSLIMNAFNAKGSALAKAGDWDNWTQNEAALQPLRERIRQDAVGKALQQYQMDDDPVALAQAVYPHVADGKSIAKVNLTGGSKPQNGLATNAAQIESAAGTPGYGLSSAQANDKPTTPDTYSFDLSDGTRTKPLTKEQLVEKVKWLSMSPAEVRQYEFAQRIAQAKLEHEKAVAGVKGEEERKTERLKGGQALVLESVKSDGAQRRTDAENASRERVGAGNNAATRYSADQHLAGAKVSASAKGAGAKQADPTRQFHNLHAEIVKTAGKEVMGALGGTKLADEDTLKMTNFAQALMEDDPELSVGEAIQQSISAYKARLPKPAPKK